MPVKRIERAGNDRVGLSSLDIDDLAAARNAIIRFEVVLVVKALLGPLLDDGVVQGKAHAVGLQQNPPAFPTRARHMAGAADDFIEGSDDHAIILAGLGGSGKRLRLIGAASGV